MLIDLAFVLLLIFFLWRGASRGFIQSLLGPLAFILATAAAFIYYQNTKNIYVSLILGLAGPFILHFFLENYFPFKRVGIYQVMIFGEFQTFILFVFNLTVSNAVGITITPQFIFGFVDDIGVRRRIDIG